ncbi:MAG TPA: histidinol dehydrogenase [Vicinamibacterales bacterium]|jgi:histidinol dehydrogenase
MLPIIDSSDTRSLAGLFDRRPSGDPAVRRRVAAIVSAVRRGGDAALRRYARRLDGLTGPLEVSPGEMIEAARTVKPAVRRALTAAARNIRIVARAQRPRTTTIRVADGLTVTERVVPLDRVGCYVPAGRYPLPSSLLMTAIPARVAGVREVFAASPRPDPVVMAAALAAGVTRLFRVGGAQAIAAFAYGTKTIPAVDKIVGPGNRYVAAAKDLVSGECAIDFHAGPSEVVVLSDTIPAAWVAADLIAQAEHDPDARAILVTTRRGYAVEVAREVALRLPASGPAATALYVHGAIVVAKDRAEAVALVNRLSPEHVLCADIDASRGITRAGTIFVGGTTVPAAGDYATGSNHVLPTAGAARFRGGLSTADFVRVIAVQQMSVGRLNEIAPTVTTLARAEGLEAHARSIEARMVSQR